MADYPHTPFPINFNDPKVKLGVIAACLGAFAAIGVIILFVIITIAYNFNILNWIE